MLGFIFVVIMTLFSSLAWDIPNVEEAVKNLTIAAFLVVSIQESSYHDSSMIPGVEWFNQYVGAPVTPG